MSEPNAEIDARNPRFSLSEIERALREADAPEDSMATDEDLLRYIGRAEAVSIFRDMLGIATRVIPSAVTDGGDA